MREKYGRGKARAREPRGTHGWAVSAAVAFLLAACLLHVAGRVPLAVPLAYVIASAAAFCVYAADKSAARAGRWRIRESTLHLAGLAGGWPGAIVARSLLRHKTRKRPFTVALWGAAVLHCAALAWLAGAPR